MLRAAMIGGVVTALALAACSARSSAPASPSAPAERPSTGERREGAATREDGAPAAAGAETVQTTGAEAPRQPPADLACGRCERAQDGSCGEWWEDGDDAGRTIAGLIPCDPRCCP